METDLAIRPLTARSVVLSLLLGAHPSELPVRDLVRLTELFAVSEATLRVALHRMVNTGDLERTQIGYRLSERLQDRQRRQDDAVSPDVAPWSGDWELVVVSGTRREPAERAELRTLLGRLRLAELREGTWIRPDNLRRPWPRDLPVRRFTARPEESPTDLAGSLWNLHDWSRTGQALLTHFASASEPADRFTTAAAIVRHLLADPVLPSDLLPATWPGDALRFAYTNYQAELRALRNAVTD